MIQRWVVARIILLLITILIGQSSQAQLTCQEVFHKTEISKPAVAKTQISLTESSLIHGSMHKNDPQFDLAFKQLIKMFAQTTFLNISEKLSFEKGELYLAHKINEDISLELEYAGDKRGEETLFRLVSYKIVRANLKSINVEKNPLTDDGQFLNQKQIELNLPLKEGQSAKDTELHLEIPVAISNDLLQLMEKWSDKFNFINRHDIRSMIEKDEMLKLYLKAQYLSGLDFSKNIIKKQSYKYVLIGLVIYASSYAMEHFIDTKIDQVVIEFKNTSKMSLDDNKLFQSYLETHQKNWKLTNQNLSTDIQRLTTVLTKKEKIMSIEAFRSTLAHLMNKEILKESEPLYYVLNAKMEAVGWLNDDQITELDFEKDKHRFLVSVFPQSESIQVSIINFSEKAKVSSIASLLIHRSNNPQLYFEILKKTPQIEIEPKPSESTLPAAI